MGKIKNFFDYFDAKERKILREALENNDVLTDDEMDNKTCPEVSYDWIEKDKIYDKLTNLILTKLEKETKGNSLYMFPTFVTVNNEKCALITIGQNSALAVTHNTNQGSVLYYFKDFELGKKEQVASVVISSNTLGITNMLDELIKIVNNKDAKVDAKVIKESFTQLLLESAPGKSHAKMYFSMSKETREWLDSQIVDAGIGEPQLKGDGEYVLDSANRSKCQKLAKDILNDAENGNANAIAVRQAITKNGEYSPNTLWYLIRRVAGEHGIGGNTYGDPEILMNKDNSDLDRVSASNAGGSRPAARPAAANVENFEDNDVNVETDEDVELDIEAGLTTGTSYDEWFEKEKNLFESNMDKIAVITKAICKYVKSHGKEESGMFRPGLLICGKGGTGKSFTMEQTLEDMSMKKDYDYISWGRRSLAPTYLYDWFYKYNGKLILMDDAAGLFDSEDKVTFWKMALNTKKSERVIPISKCVDGASVNSKYYPTVGKSRKERYLIEIGDRGRLVSREIPRNVRTAEQREAWLRDYDRRREEAEKNATPGIPDQFLFTGAVIMVTNSDEAKMMQIVKTKGGGEGNWNALVGRFGSIIQIDPPTRVIWAAIKSRLLAEKESNRPDSKCLVPRPFIDEFIKVTEENLTKNMSGNIDWRIASTIGHMLTSPEGERFWVQELENAIKTGKARDWNAANRSMPHADAHF